MKAADEFVKVSGLELLVELKTENRKPKGDFRLPSGLESLINADFNDFADKDFLVEA